MRPIPGVRVTVLAREPETPYSGMLPGLIAGHYRFDDIHVDLERLCRLAGARLLIDEAVGLDLEQKRVRCAVRPAVRFDVLSLDVGGVPGAHGAVLGSRVYPVKPIGRLFRAWSELRVALSENRVQRQALVVVGGGAGGCELALAIGHALEREGIDCALALVTAGARVLDESHNPRTARRLMAALGAMRIDVETKFKAVRAGDGAVEAADGRRRAADFVLWATGVRAPDFLREAGLATDADGFVQVDATLRSTSHPGVFAAGDVAALPDPRPKSGVFAVREGPALAHNLRAALTDGRLEAFRPQRRFLSLISEGARRAVASRGLFGAEGGWVWRWKDRIDRRFIARYAMLAMPVAARVELPSALAADAPDPMRCGGCGSKLGADLLARVLRDIDVPSDASVDVGIGDDAAIFRAGGGRVLATVDAFRAPIDDAYRFGRIATHHALSDVYAMGGRPTAALVLATIPLMADAMMEDELRQVMLGASAVLAGERVALVGGHSSEGADLAVGFAIIGEAPATPLTKAGLRAGDALVLTKPLGTGLVLAASMRGAARARDVRAAIEVMDRSNASAAEVFRRFDVRACTDVTGFGFLGHLAEMLRASKLGAEVELERVPLLPGALDVVRAGIESSLVRHNADVLRDFAVSPRADERVRVLIDPQTAGGLLAGVASDAAPGCVEALRAAGHEAAIVGRVVGDIAPGRGRIVA